MNEEMKPVPRTWKQWNTALLTAAEVYLGTVFVIWSFGSYYNWIDTRWWRFASHIEVVVLGYAWVCLATLALAGTELLVNRKLAKRGFLIGTAALISCGWILPTIS